MTVPNKLHINEDWVCSNFLSNNWAITRNPHGNKPGGFLINLDKPTLFGNFLFHDDFGGSFAPYTYVVKSAMHIKRTYQFVAIPIHVPLATIQLPDMYPPCSGDERPPIQ